MRDHLAMAAATAMTAVLLGTAPAQSADLTGVWFGQQKCDRFDGTKFVTKFLDDVMVISQTGSEIRVAALLIDGAFQLIYQGTVIDSVSDPERKGQAAFTECTTAPGSSYQETGRATKVDVKPNGDGKFEGTSNFFEVGVDGGPADTGTCAWTYKRVEIADVGVPSCGDLLSALQAQGSQSRRRP
jgi:hypothetical protein